MRSTLPPTRNALHVGIIMDGNGRWAVERGLPRSAGHRAGVDAVRRVVEASPTLGIGTLTLYAFSSANWDRPPGEVRQLLGLLRDYLCSETAACASRGVRLGVIGRRDRLPLALRAAILTAERVTARGAALHLRLALDYSGRESILRAAAGVPRDRALSAAEFARRLARVEAGGRRGTVPAPDVDLLIRSGGEQRLSDFLLWESAYAELVFTPTMWPDFAAADLERAVSEFRHRDRRFGGLPRRAAS
jgi:undecaprenyl diphosphate synthase